ncbi:MAG: phage protein Gp27 family protein [Pseudomonadota bacterium]
MDLVPDELKKALKDALRERGWGDIVAMTEQLNEWLADEGMDLRVSKTQVGKYAQLKKMQEEALEVSRELLADMGVEKEAEIHKAMLHMLTTLAVQLMMKATEEDGGLDAKDLMNIGRMMKDVMSSVGIREKILDEERQRIKAEERAAVAGQAEEVARKAGLSKDAAKALRQELLGIAA